MAHPVTHISTDTISVLGLDPVSGTLKLFREVDALHTVRLDAAVTDARAIYGDAVFAVTPNTPSEELTDGDRFVKLSVAIGSNPDHVVTLDEARRMINWAEPLVEAAEASFRMERAGGELADKARWRMTDRLVYMLGPVGVTLRIAHEHRKHQDGYPEKLMAELVQRNERISARIFRMRAMQAMEW